MTAVVETCRLKDGLTVKRLRHYKCPSCAHIVPTEAAPETVGS